MRPIKQHAIRTCFSKKVYALLITVLTPLNSSFAETPQKNLINTELPTVSYIIPWKSPPMGKIAGKPLESLANKDVLKPLDREVFKRKLKYYNLFKNEHNK